MRRLGDIARAIWDTSGVPTDTKSVMYELLYRVLLQIRMDSNGRGDSTQVARVNALSNMAHNWPHQLEHASSGPEYDAILREAWRLCSRRARPWLERHLQDLEVDISSL